MEENESECFLNTAAVTVL